MPKHVYVASHAECGSISHFSLADDGDLTLQQEYRMNESPDYLTVSGNRLHVLLREPLRGQSGVLSYAIQPDGALRKTDDPIPTRGSIASYVLEYRDKLYVTNYIQGTTICLPDRMIVHMGSGTDPIRQKCSHPHCIVPIPQTDELCIADLGTDSLIVVRPDLELVSQLRLRPGTGPRHITFTQDGTTGYCVTEMGNTVVVVKYCGERLIPVGEYSTLPPHETTQSTAAAIRLDEKRGRLYVSNRGHDSICCYEIEGDTLTAPKWFSSMGRSPRDFQIVGDHLLCANEKTNDVVSIYMGGKTPEIVSTASVVCPWAIGIYPGKA